MRHFQSGLMAIVATVALNVVLFAQAPYDPVLDQGIIPFQAYDGGNLDSVNLATGNLSVHIPIVSFPQRGGILDVSYFIAYSSFSMTLTCPYQGQPCYYVPSGGQKVALVTSALPYLVGATYPTGPGSYRGTESLVEGSNSHLLGWLTNTQLRSLDGSGFYATITGNGTTITSSNGIVFAQATLGSSNYTATDPNGNKLSIVVSSQSTAQITDTMGRVISPPPGISTSDLSNCDNGVTQAWNWTVPGPNGSNAVYKLCGPFGVYSSLVLPNLTKYDFQTTSVPIPQCCNNQPGTVDVVSKITLPSGGSISWGYGATAVLGTCSNNYYYYAPVMSRTVDANDGSGPKTWTYSRQITSGNVVTTVIDPLGNKSIHTFNSPLGVCEPYESQDQEYDSHGNLLKTVNTSYSSIANPGGVGGGPAALDVVPISVTTVWPNSKETMVSKTYDSNHGANFRFGVWLDQLGVEYGPTPIGYTANPWTEVATDFGQGTPGSPLRTTNTSYLAFANSNYFANNLLDLSSSVQIQDGGSVQREYTTFGYDETGLQPSNVTEQKTTGESYPGNQTSVHRWLSNGSAVASSTCNVSVSSGGYLVTNNVFFDTGKIQKSTDPCLYPTTYQYSSTYYGAFPTTVTNALGQSTTYSYDMNTGLVTSMTDSNSQVTTKAYDILGRLTAVVYPNMGSTTYCYTDLGGATCNQSGPPYSAVETKAIKAGLNETFTVQYDGLGRKVQTQLNSDPDGVTYTQTAYDALGRKSQVYNPTRCNPPTANCGETTWGYATYNYDAINRVTSVVEQDGSTINTAFASFPCTTVTDETVKARQSCVDGLGRLTGVWEDPGSGPHLNYETDYTYDVLGNLIGVTQRGSNGGNARTRTFTYDSLSRLTSANNPESGLMSYGYDADGNAISRTSLSPNQLSTGTKTATTSYSFDTLNRLVAKGYNDGYASNNPTPGASYAYDGNSLTGCTTNPPPLADGYPLGRRTAMCDGSGATSWAHDKMGRVLQERRTIGAVSGDYENDVFNLDGSVASVTSLGYGVAYSPGAAGRPVKAMHSTTNIVTSVSYAPPGQTKGMTLGLATGFAGITVVDAYNPRGQPILLSAASPSGTVFSECFDFHSGVAVSGPSPCSFGASAAGDDGNVYQIVNNRDSTRTENFIYDSLNRIQQAYSSGTQWGETFGPSATNPGVPPTISGIDSWGNLVNRSGVTGKNNYEPLSVSAGTNNRLVGFGYDPAGNMTSNGTASYVYDDENRLIWTNSASGTRYLYDGDGKRVEKCAAATSATACSTSGTNGTLYWTGTGNDALSETDLSGNVENTYIFFNGQRIARSDSAGAFHFYFSDHLGSHGVVENATGTTCEQDIDYYPYGGVENDYCPALVQNYRFTGKERDTESGLDNFGARYNASSMGRFMTPDSLNTLDLSHPQKLNRYAYANNNPLSNVDVGGHCTAPAVSGGQVGICVESYIQARFLPGVINHLALARGDNRGPNPHGGTFRTQTLLSVDPSSHEVKLQGQAAGKSCAIEGCYLGVNNSYLSKATHDDKGNTYFTLIVYGENGYEANGKAGAPGGWIEMQFSFTVNSKGEVTVSSPETKGYPSASIYSYDSGGNAQDVWQQTESGNINDLVGPRKPVDSNQQSNHVQEDADRLCALGNPAACD